MKKVRLGQRLKIGKIEKKFGQIGGQKLAKLKNKRQVRLEAENWKNGKKVWLGQRLKIGKMKKKLGQVRG